MTTRDIGAGLRWLRNVTPLMHGALDVIGYVLSGSGSVARITADAEGRIQVFTLVACDLSRLLAIAALLRELEAEHATTP